MMVDPLQPCGPLIGSRLRLLTWNVWGRFGPWEQRQTGIAAILAEQAPDVVALQEASSRARSLSSARARRRGGAAPPPVFRRPRGRRRDLGQCGALALADRHCGALGFARARRPRGQ